MSLSAYADDLISLDLISSGDGLITEDTATGLEWLSLGVTAGLSFNQASQSSFVTQMGFSHASQQQVYQLVSDATGLPFTFPGAPSGGTAHLSSSELMASPLVVGSVQLFNLLHASMPPPNLSPVGDSQSLLTGLTGDPLGLTGQLVIGAWQAHVENAGNGYFYDFDHLSSVDLGGGASPDVPFSGGDWMVRQIPVPEPPSLTIGVWFLLLVAGCHAFRSPRGRKQL